MKSSIISLRAAGLALALATLPQILQADPFLFDTDDLLLGIQASSGTGTSQNIFFNLGNTVDIKNNPNQGVVGNIAADLAATYGNNWFSRTDLFFGVFGNRSNISPTIEPGTPPQEPGRTIYVSSATSAAGAATLRTAFGSGTLGTGGTKFLGIKNYLVISDPPTSTESFTATASGATVLDSILHPTSWNNSWTKWNPVPGTGFEIFASNPNGFGAIQNRFGTGSEVLVDVQRMVASTPTTYVTTVGIDSAGNVRLFTAAPASAYTTWINTFPLITAPADKLASADPDKDDIENVLEFVLNGNPSVSSQTILPTLDASGTNFVFSFNRRDDSQSPETTQTFQYGTDLVNWTDVNIGAASAGVVTVNENGAAADGIIVTIPKGVNTKLFGRFKVVK